LLIPVQVNVTELDLNSGLISISTSKSKAEPAGTFSINVAPNINWVSAIAAGSWVAIHIADRAITAQDKKLFNSQTLKMIGRID